jgi:ribosome maturation factor RimP
MVLEIDRVREVAERVAASMGLEVVEVEFRGGGKARMLRITIDKPEGVTHEDCANVSRDVGTILDVEDVVPGSSYLLEVSSPGLDRRLSRPADFERFTGSLIKVTTREPVDGNRHFEGRIQSFQDGRITLELGGPKKLKGAKGRSKKQEAEVERPRLDIDLANVEKANLVPEI